MRLEDLKARLIKGRDVWHRRLGELMAELDGRRGEEADLVGLAAVLVSQALEQGHVCISVKDAAGKRHLERIADHDDDSAFPGVEAPEESHWLRVLESSPAVSRNGAEPRPLVLDADGRLYLRRYWEYEQRLAACLGARQGRVDVDPAAVRAQLDRVFQAPESDQPDWQRVAAAVALGRRLAIITGGAGTGKTTTVVKILLALRQLEGKDLRMQLAAPTGKAAARLVESIRGAKKHLPLAAEELEAIPEAASTIHRLLGVRRHSPEFRHHADNPLALDVLVLDEASMVDLALMCKLMEALPPGARVILLGDPHQLAAVEAGAVLADLAGQAANAFSADFHAWLEAACGHPLPERDPEGAVLPDCVVELKRTHRNAGAVLALAEAIKAGDWEGARALLEDPDAEAVEWRQEDKWLNQALQQTLESWFQNYLHASPAEALERVNDFRILCAHRDGQVGVEMVNRRVEGYLRREGLVRSGEWYPGRPVMITRNDYDLGLYNGDVGICLHDADSDSLRVWFPDPQVSGSARAFAPGRLPEHETVYAMTVHKTQGSEFDRVLLLLPEVSVLVDRGLLYTAVTRARSRVCIHGGTNLLPEVCQRSSAGRRGGLAHALQAAAVMSGDTAVP